MPAASASITSQIVFETVESPALLGNPLGDPHRRRTPVYLPPGYGADPARRYPLAIMLPAIFVSGDMLLAPRPFGEPLAARLDRLIAEQRMPPMIVALPDGRSRYGTGQYLDSPAVGDYEGFVLDVVAHLDRTFATAAHRDQRAVLGKSSGGFGALRLGMRRPDVFGMVADHSGDKGFELCYRSHVPQFLDRTPDLDAVKRHLAHLDATYAAAAHPLDFVHRVNLPAMAACYSPDPDAPLGFELPVELGSGRWRPEVWSRWLAHDPIHAAAAHADALRSLKLLYLDCGDRDEHFLHYGGRQLAAELGRLGVPHVYEEFPGGHRETEHRYDVSLSAIGRAIGGAVHDG